MRTLRQPQDILSEFLKAIPNVNVMVKKTGDPIEKLLPVMREIGLVFNFQGQALSRVRVPDAYRCRHLTGLATISLEQIWTCETKMR